MANYTIIGGDQKEYGPVTGEEIRQWIAEGRLDANSQARLENEAAWRPLSAFPEFAASFQPRPASPPPPFGARPSVARQGDIQEVKAPAITLIVIGALGALLALYTILGEIIHPESADQVMAQLSSMPPFNQPEFQKQLHDPQIQSLLHASSGGGMAIGTSVFNLVMCGVVLWGAVRMLQGRNYEFACLAAILVMIPCLIPCQCCCLGLPVGIWALMVLRKPEVKGQFL